MARLKSSTAPTRFPAASLAWARVRRKYASFGAMLTGNTFASSVPAQPPEDVPRGAGEADDETAVLQAVVGVEEAGPDCGHVGTERLNGQCVEPARANWVSGPVSFQIPVRSRLLMARTVASL